jgi:gamma-polyglutamate biosynthesis protein CapC
MGSATLFVGLILSTLMVEVTGLYPGGIIVPGYMALFLDQPLRIAVTLLASALAYMTYRLLARWLLLFGRRRFVALIFLGAAWAMLMSLLLPPLAGDAFTWQVIGWVIPGLIANTLVRQSPLATALSLIVATGGTFLIMQLITTVAG